jgi:hypothetical protein
LHGVLVVGFFSLLNNLKKRTDSFAPLQESYALATRQSSMPRRSSAVLSAVLPALLIVTVATY